MTLPMEDPGNPLEPDSPLGAPVPRRASQETAPRRPSLVPDSVADQFPTEGTRVLYFALFLGVVGLSVAFGLYMQRGCVMVPFISDLGTRSPEGDVFTATICVIVPLVAVGVSSRQIRLLRELEKSSKPVGLWVATVIAGCLACAAAMLAASTAWDELWTPHFYGAWIFFSFSLLFMIGTLGVWMQLGYLRANIPSEPYVKLTIVAAFVHFLCGTVGTPLWIVYGPTPPCQTGVNPTAAIPCILPAERETNFQSFCRGEQGSHSNFGGNLAATLEWLALVCIATAAVAIVHQGPRQEAGRLLSSTY